MGPRSGNVLDEQDVGTFLLVQRTDQIDQFADFAGRELGDWLE